MNISDSKDTDTTHLPKIKTRPDWLKPVIEEDRPASPEPNWVIPPNNLPETDNNWANSLASSYQDPYEYKLLWQIGDMGSFINWFCKQIGKKKLSKANLEGPTFKCHLLLTDQVDLVNPEGHRVVPDVSKPLPLGGPPCQEIVLRRADYKEYKISEAYFKNLHPNDFEDLYLLYLQGQLNHSSGADKVHLFNAVNLWIRNIIIRKHVEDLQFRIESYQTKLNLTQTDWDAYNFLFKEDYTIVSKPRAVIYVDKNDQKKMMQESEMHKFSDGTLNRILDKLDHMVKDFNLFKYNPGMETRIWSKDDRRRSKEFMELIERKLKIRRIFRSLESFVGGRLRDADYRLIQRTK
ncbi:hypothetical protein Tco_1259521 [Tanacetum coccineum]